MENSAGVALEIFPSQFPQVFEVPHPPEKLWIAAQSQDRAKKILEQLPSRALAIVGARKASARNLHQVRTVVRELPETFVVVSGLAHGIDACAHQAALSAGIPTVAVLAGGLDQLYPRDHIGLAREIVANGGLLLSEFPPDSIAKKFTFLKRNRLIAGLSRAAWVVQAQARSGALNTAAWARKQDRLIFCTPCHPGDPEMSGNQILLDRDHALPLWSVNSLASEWLELAGRGTSPTKPADASRFAHRVLQHLAKEGVLSIEAALAMALREGQSAANFFEEIEAMKSRRWISVGPDFLKLI